MRRSAAGSGELASKNLKCTPDASGAGARKDAAYVGGAVAPGR